MTTLSRRWFNWQASVDGRTRLVLLAFMLLAAQPLVVGELNVLLSPHRHATVVGIVAGFVILAAILAVLLGALVRRRWWAWLVLVFLFSIAVILDVLKFNGMVTLVRDVAGLALLMSRPMRRYVHRTAVSAHLQGSAGEGPHAG
jgi:hypothetical protein